MATGALTDIGRITAFGLSPDAAKSCGASSRV
jgi:hypothetical protein